MKAILLATCIICVVDSFCLFDNIQPEIDPRQDLEEIIIINQHATAKSAKHHKKKRQATGANPYMSIKINISYHDLDQELTNEQQDLLKVIVEKTVKKAEDIFLVNKHTDPLLLSRSKEACYIIWTSGPNAGRCKDVRNGYKGEFCIDNFKIPDAHLKGLKVYGENGSEPIRIIKEDGTGLINTDFVLYIRALSMDKCLHDTLQTIAYASYCKLDYNHRPLAGYINFCPSLLSKENYNWKKLYFIALHELFHTLGFSKKLYDKFWECDSLNNCFVRKNTVKTVLGEQRLVTPKLVQISSEHFGCKTHASENEFAPILETRNGDIFSHWDSAFMYSSIMTPKIGLPEETLIDPLTLAVFEDTGWYKVNYSQADYFPWGLGGGCSWGKHPECVDTIADDHYYCNMLNKAGCHYLHFAKGSCQSDSFLHGCSVFKSEPKDLCTELTNTPSSSQLSITGEVYGKQSCCFTANLTLQQQEDDTVQDVHSIEGRCYFTRCVNNRVEVKVGSTPWVECPSKQTIQISGYRGILKCPSKNIICKPKPLPSIPIMNTTKKPHKFTKLPKMTSTTTVKTSGGITFNSSPSIVFDDYTVVCVDVKFSSLQYNFLITAGLQSKFKESCLFQLMSTTAVVRRRINNILVLPGSTIFRFDLLPARYSRDGPSTSSIIHRLQMIINDSKFTIVLEGISFIASDLMFMEGGPTLSVDDTPKGIIAGVIIGSLIIALLIGVAVFFVQRYYTVHSRNVARSETTQLDRRRSTESSQTNRSSNNIIVMNTHHASLQPDLQDQLQLQVVSLNSNPQNISLNQQLQGSHQQYTCQVNAFDSSMQDCVQHRHGSASNDISPNRYTSFVGNSNYGFTSEAEINREDVSATDSHQITGLTMVSESSSPSGGSGMLSTENMLSNTSSNPMPPVLLHRPRTKTRIIKCKCEWLKKKFKKGNTTGVENLQNSTEKTVSSNGVMPNVNCEANDDNVAENAAKKTIVKQSGSQMKNSIQKYNSAVYQSSNVSCLDYNANVCIPQCFSTGDIHSLTLHSVSQNPAPSISTSHNSSEDIESAITSRGSDLSSRKESGVSFHSAGTEVSFSSNPLSTSVTKMCCKNTNNDDLLLYKTKITVCTSGKNNNALSDVNTSVTNLDRASSHSTLDTAASGSVLTKATTSSEGDVSLIVQNIHVKGKDDKIIRNSTTSWQSFSSDTSRDSNIARK